MNAPPPPVMVTWEDASTRSAEPWVDNVPIEYKPVIFVQVGFILADTPEGIVMTQAWGPDKVAAPDQIPRGMIRSIVPLVPAPTPKRRTRS